MIRVREMDSIFQCNSVRSFEEKIVRRGGKTYRLLLKPEDLTSPNLVMLECSNPFNFSKNLYIGNLDPQTVEEMMTEAASGLLDISHLKTTAVEVKNPSEIPKVGVYYQYGAFASKYKPDSNGLILADDEAFECCVDNQVESAEDMDYWNDDDWEEREEEVDY